MPVLLALLLAGIHGGAAPAPDGGVVVPAFETIPASRAELFLFGEEKAPQKEPRCSEASGAARVRCLVALRYGADPAASKLALALFDGTGSVAGLLEEQDFDGSYRGIIHLVPELPVGKLRNHLEWAAGALLDHDEFFRMLGSAAPSPLRYRWKPLELGFYRSVKKRTPAAWASGWAINYNNNGTLNYGPDVVRELLFHEVFHLNDAEHGHWSATALGALYDKVVKKCGTRKDCLAPWAPAETSTMGTYYAFVPANGVGEYAAELAIRYYREQRTAAQGKRVQHPFKCQTKENAVAWEAIAKEFFGGADRIPPCR